MTIIEYGDEYAENTKDLLVELQRYLASLDERGVIVLKDNYREDYFRYVSEEVKKHNGKILQGGGEENITTSCPKVDFISDLVVTEEERGKGIGRRLLRQVNDYFMQNGCEYT